MTDPGLVVVLDGPRCVGRSTTLAALQEAWPRVRSGPLLEVGLDAALRAFGPGARRWRELVLPDAHASARGPQVGWGPLGRELVVGVHRCAATWARAGFDVGLDQILMDQATTHDLDDALTGLERLHVGLVCDEDVLDERERELHATGLGTAVAQLRAGRELFDRDLVLDTTETTTDELVEDILAAVAGRQA